MKLFQLYYYSDSHFNFAFLSLEVSRKDPINVKARRMRACMMKTFNRMRKRWGFLLYQFALPALQVQNFQHILKLMRITHQICTV